MGDSAIKQRQRAAKKKTLSNLQAIYRYVMPQPTPDCLLALYFVPKIKSFYAVCIDGVSEKASKYLGDLKRNSAADISVFVHAYNYSQKDSEKIEIS